MLEITHCLGCIYLNIPINYLNTTKMRKLICAVLLIPAIVFPQDLPPPGLPPPGLEDPVGAGIDQINFALIITAIILGLYFICKKQDLSLFSSKKKIGKEK